MKDGTKITLWNHTITGWAAKAVVLVILGALIGFGYLLGVQHG